jgi:hypothetical protein
MTMKMGWKLLTPERTSPFAPVVVQYSTEAWVEPKPGDGPLMVYVSLATMCRVHWEQFARRMALHIWRVEYEHWDKPLDMLNGRPVSGWCRIGGVTAQMTGVSEGVALAKRVRLLREITRNEFATMLEETRKEVDREAMDLRFLQTLYPPVG